MPFALSPERDRELSEILTRYPTKMAACIPALHLCQDQHGWIDDDIVHFVSHRLDLPPAHVKGVVTFYTLFNQHPVGKHQVWVCKTLPCALRGAGDVLAQCERKLGIKPGETTPDGKVTLRTAECLASCGTAPMMRVDKDYHENLAPADVDRILDALMKGQAPAPTPVKRPAAKPAGGPGASNLGSAGPFGGGSVSGSVKPPSPAAGSVKPPSSAAPGTLPAPTPPPRPSSKPPPAPVVAKGPAAATPPPPPKTPSARPPGAPSDATAPSAEKTSSTSPPKDESGEKKKTEKKED
jgi:NADH-quinone oxidoreductase subunit E